MKKVEEKKTVTFDQFFNFEAPKKEVKETINVPVNKSNQLETSTK